MRINSIKTQSLVIAGLLSLSCNAFTANNPSFDCAKASTFVEKSICSDSKLSELDILLMSSYKKAYSTTKDQESLKTEQKSWLKNVRNTCQNNKCLEDAYNSRMSQLNTSSPVSSNKHTNSADKITTFEGEVSVGTLDSGVGDASFMTDSDVGNKILEKCGHGDTCKVTSVVDDKDNIKSVISAERVKTTPLSIPPITNPEIQPQSSTSEPKQITNSLGTPIKVCVVFDTGVVSTGFVFEPTSKLKADGYIASVVIDGTFTFKHKDYNDIIVNCDREYGYKKGLYYILDETAGGKVLMYRGAVRSDDHKYVGVNEKPIEM